MKCPFFLIEEYIYIYIYIYTNKKNGHFIIYMRVFVRVCVSMCGIKHECLQILCTGVRSNK